MGRSFKLRVLRAWQVAACVGSTGRTCIIALTVSDSCLRRKRGWLSATSMSSSSTSWAFASSPADRQRPSAASIGSSMGWNASRSDGSSSEVMKLQHACSAATWEGEGRGAGSMCVFGEGGGAAVTWKQAGTGNKAQGRGMQGRSLDKARGKVWMQWQSAMGTLGGEVTVRTPARLWQRGRGTGPAVAAALGGVGACAPCCS